MKQVASKFNLRCIAEQMLAMSETSIGSPATRRADLTNFETHSGRQSAADICSCKERESLIDPS